MASSRKYEGSLVKVYEIVRIMNGLCHYCKCQTFKTYELNKKLGIHRVTTHRNDDVTRDHVIPKSKGGTGGKTVRSCKACNNARGNMPYEAFKVNTPSQLP